MLRVYLASWFDSKDERAKQAQELRSLGIEVTSRWLEELPDAELNNEFLNSTANIDIEDIELANTMVIFTPKEAPVKTSSKCPTCPPSCLSWARGGRNFEQGYFYAMIRFFEYLPASITTRGKRELIICGPRETLFHWTGGGKLRLPAITKQFDTWPEVVEYLRGKA